MYNKLLFKDEGRKELIKGVNTLVDAVKVTLGGNGKNVIILDKLSHPHVTKDGVTVAKSIMLRNDVQQGGVEVVRQASIKAANETGDGTTTATILAGSMINQGSSVLDRVNIQSFREGMERAGEDIKTALDEMSENVAGDVTSLIEVATISANGDKTIGTIVGQSIFDSGKDGVYSVDKADGKVFSGITFAKEEGYSFKQEIKSQFETEPGSGKCYLENPDVLILNCYLGNASILQEVYDDKPLVVMYKDVDGTLLHSLAVSFARRDTKVVLCPLPDWGETQEQSVLDICAGTGAIAIDTLQNTLPEEKHLGKLKAFDYSGATVKLFFQDDVREEIEARAKNVRKALEEAKEEDKHMYEKRFNRLSNGVGVFKIGAHTNVEYQEIKDKVDDTIGSVICAMEEGIVTGGGIALLEASTKIKRDLNKEDESFKEGYNIVIRACHEPFIQILNNCGLSNEAEVESVKKGIERSDFKLGYNAKTKKVSNLKEEGIIDAVKVTKVSLASAISASIGLLTTDCVIFPEDNEM